jgi:hypothetical protein
MAITYHNLYGAAGGASPPPCADIAVPLTTAIHSSDVTSDTAVIECYLYTLPNELALHILSLLTTAELLPLAPVSHRLHTLTIRLLHTRLLKATRFPAGALILECYPPSQKLTAPALDCLYIDTPGIESCLKESSVVGNLDALRDLYCRFKPQRREWRRFGRNIPGDIPGSRTHPTSAAVVQARWQAERDEEVVKQILSLEGHELFIQLEGNLHLVRQMGFIQNLVAVHEGYVRIWRDWLGQQAEAEALEEVRQRDLVETEAAGPSMSENSDVSGKNLVQKGNAHDHESILWLDGTKNVGLRVRVQEKRWRRNMPILMYAEEEISVSYEVAYEGSDSLENVGQEQMLTQIV